MHSRRLKHLPEAQKKQRTSVNQKPARAEYQLPPSPDNEIAGAPEDLAAAPEDLAAAADESTLEAVTLVGEAPEQKEEAERMHTH